MSDSGMPSLEQIKDAISERRQQRDWLGHGLQVAGILIVIGVPLLIWGSGINTAVATLNERSARQERDITNQSAAQTVVTNQLIELTRTLTRIDTQLGDTLRDQKKR